jgi:carboxypeptidase Taq
LQNYEEENTIERLDVLFENVRNQLAPLLEKIKNQPKPNVDFLHKNYPKNAQWEFGRTLLNKLGFDFDRGRIDTVVHPFCTSFSPDDIRITTLVNENNLAPMVWSTIHECGHALYEQGLNRDEYGMPLGEAISLSVHESQSRLWENNICRSFEFWNANWPMLNEHFSEQLQGVTPFEFYQAINAVEPSIVRIEADELTYHFHIMIRYEIEKMLIGAEIETTDLPRVWNEKYKHYLGIDITNDLLGCLQDVHWCHGLFGYFPTYSQGSFMAAQWLVFAKKQIPTLEAELAAGNTENLLKWLRENIHQHGRHYTSKELCEKVTGEPLNAAYFMEYATKKYQELYKF